MKTLTNKILSIIMNNDYILKMNLLFIIITLAMSMALLSWLSKEDSGTGKQVYLSNLIRTCAFSYLKKQYLVIFAVAIPLAIITWKFLGILATLTFFMGIMGSTFAGFFGMNMSTLSNVKILEAAKRKGIYGAFRTAIYSALSGSIFLISLAIISIIYAWILSKHMSFCQLSMEKAFIGLSMGASLVSIFARLGGGIFTKGADVGADLVGKVEKNIPEDDSRNPAVIADCVGDNVGDCSGMSADLFQSYIVTITSAMILLYKFSTYTFLLPISICSTGLLAGILPIFFMKFKNIWSELKNYFFTSLFLFILLMRGFVYLKQIDMISFYCITIGAISVQIILKITEYYTSSSFRPVQKIMEASKYGASNNILSGLALSYESIALPFLTIIIGIITCYYLLGIAGVAFAVIGATALSPSILVLDYIGPTSDNAGGICEMSGIESSVREVTDELDAVGNTTKAITKGFSIASALFASILMFYLFIKDLKIINIQLTYEMDNPLVLCSLLGGMIIPCLFAGSSITSVSDAAQAVVKNIRKQFENPKILEGTEEPNYKETVDFLTMFSIKRMIIPSLLPIVIPTILFLVVNKISGIYLAFSVFGMLLIGMTLAGSLLSISMTTIGGSWDNAKKSIEQLGLKGSEQHKAAVIGDTIGDPYKDTTGPSFNVLMKIGSLIGLFLIYSHV